MAIQWMDNFSLYGAQARLADGVYAAATAAIVNDPDPVANAAGSRVIRTEFNQRLRRVLNSAQPTVGQACRFWVNSLGSSSSIFQFNDVNIAIIVNIRADGNGRIVASRGDGTVLGSSTNPVTTANSWQHIEARVTVGTGTAGSVEVRVEGIPVLVLNGINTQGDRQANVQSVTLGNETAQFGQGFYKDWVIWDGTGTLNNTFLGSVQVITLLPNADVSTGWSLTGAATATGAIAELTPNDDTSFISAGTGPIPAPTITELTDLPVSVTSIRALMPFVRARKVDGGDGNLQVGLTSGGSTANGADRPITTAYTYWTDVIERDPATNAQWLPSAVNSARLRINRTL